MNQAQKAYAAYAQNRILTASPAELTLMLYEGAIKFANIADAAIENGDVEKAHTNIMKVRDIILEFQSTLNYSYSVANDFNNVYEYIKLCLTEANLKKDKEMMQEVLKNLRIMRDTWKEVMIRIVSPRQTDMQEREHIQLLIQSLDKKIKTLEEISNYNLAQKELLEQERPDMEIWQKLIESKAEKIDEINFLDEGFTQVYDRVKEGLLHNREQFEIEIKKLKEQIGRITDLSMSIQVQEERNKQMAQKQFANYKKEICQVKQNSRAASIYENQMKKLNVIEAQFLDRKK